MSGGVKPPLAAVGIPLASIPPSIFPSLLASIPLASLTSNNPSLSESKSYGLGLPSVSVSGGVSPPLAETGIPSLSTAPSILPSPLASVPLDSFASVIPSLSESKSKLLMMPSPSVSQVAELGVQAAFSTVSKMPSLSSSKSFASRIPSPSESGPTGVNITDVVLVAMVPLMLNPIVAVPAVALLVKTTVYVPLLLLVTVPNVPELVVTRTVPPLVVKLALELSFNCIVMVDVLVPLATILVGEAVIVDLVGSAVIATAVNVTAVVLVAVVPLILKPIVAVPAVALLVKTTVYVPLLLLVTVPNVPKLVVTRTVPPLVVKLALELSFNCIVMVDVLVPLATILVGEAVIVDLVGSATITFTIVAKPSTTSLLEIKFGVLKVPAASPKLIENCLFEIVPIFPFLNTNSVNGLSKFAINEALFSNVIPLKLVFIPKNLVLFGLLGDTPIVKPVGLLTV